MSKVEKMVPRNSQVLIKLDEEKSHVSEFGLSTPSNEEHEKKAIGTVVAVGSSEKAKDIKIGDRVVFGLFAGDDVEINEEDYKLVDEEFVLAFLK